MRWASSDEPTPCHSGFGMLRVMTWTDWAPLERWLALVELELCGRVWGGTSGAMVAHRRGTGRESKHTHCSGRDNGRLIDRGAAWRPAGTKDGGQQWAWFQAQLKFMVAGRSRAVKGRNGTVGRVDGRRRRWQRWWYRGGDSGSGREVKAECVSTEVWRSRSPAKSLRRAVAGGEAGWRRLGA